MLGLRFMLRSHTLYIDCLCFDMSVHKLASSKTTVDLNKAKGMLLFNSVLRELGHSGGGGRKVGRTDGSLNNYVLLCVANRPLWTSGGNVCSALVVNSVFF